MLLAEVRQLRAENAALRAAYEQAEGENARLRVALETMVAALDSFRPGTRQDWTGFTEAVRQVRAATAPAAPGESS